MTKETKKMAGIIILTVPTIAYGGYFLLTVLSGQADDLALTDFQKSMFRAGHAHAGVLVILSLVALLYVDAARLSPAWKWAVRVSFPLAAILVSGGFFAAAIGRGLTQPNEFIAILFVGVFVLIFGLITLGVGLMRK
jgi:hypothetical protein